MASYIQIYNRRMSNDAPFLARLEVAVAKFAAYCKNTSTNEAWWPDALANPAAKVQAMAWEVCFDPTISEIEDTNAITDAQIQAAVEAVALRY